MMRPDRGAHPVFRFEVCAKGFLITSGSGFGEIGVQYAFDRIDDVAAWIAYEYRHAHDSSDGKPESPDQ